MDARFHARRLRKAPGSGRAGILARRNPVLLLLLPGDWSLRLAARKFCALLFQEPPRTTRPSHGLPPLVNTISANRLRRNSTVSAC